MTNEYTKPEVLEIGEANEVILGAKLEFAIDDDTRTVEPDGDLDE
jgi:hypothetical protein